MTFLLQDRLSRAMALTHDLVAHLEEAALALDLPRLPSNRLAGQLWCMVGARESYLAALEAGSWQGFRCSLKTPKDKGSVLEALESTATAWRAVEVSGLDGPRVAWAFDLLEHEVQHHGQLIRYVYGNGLSFPPSWHERYTV